MGAVLAIDPGQSGALVWLNGREFKFELMPVKSDGKTKDIDFNEVRYILEAFKALKDGPPHIVLERALPFGMPATSLFNYARGFAALEIALALTGLGATYIEPAKWSKAMHEGIAKDLKPKAKSQIAVTRLFPDLISAIPKAKGGKLHEGVVDALLMAAFWQRQIQPPLNRNDF